MTIVAQQTQVSESYARKLTENIRRTAVNAKENIDKLNDLIVQAKNGNAHLALGYKSWTAYLSDTLSETPMLLEQNARQSFALQLADEGMSSRSIAPIVGVSDRQVRRDLAQVGHNVPPEPESYWSPEESFVGTNPLTGEVIESEPKAVTGLDGKTYVVPSAPRLPQRKALTDVARDAGWELRKAVERVQKLTEDDRFNRNKTELAAHLRGHLLFTVEAAQELLDILTQEEK